MNLRDDLLRVFTRQQVLQKISVESLVICELLDSLARQLTLKYPSTADSTLGASCRDP